MESEIREKETKQRRCVNQTKVEEKNRRKRETDRGGAEQKISLKDKKNVMDAAEVQHGIDSGDGCLSASQPERGNR